MLIIAPQESIRYPVSIPKLLGPILSEKYNLKLISDCVGVSAHDQLPYSCGRWTAPIRKVITCSSVINTRNGKMIMFRGLLVHF